MPVNSGDSEAGAGVRGSRSLCPSFHLRDPDQEQSCKTKVCGVDSAVLGTSLPGALWYEVGGKCRFVKEMGTLVSHSILGALTHMPAGLQQAPRCSRSLGRLPSPPSRGSEGARVAQ